MDSFQSLIDTYFERLTYLIGTLNHVHKVFREESLSMEKYKSNNQPPPFISGTHLVISDLIGDTDKDYEINYSTGKIRTVYYDEYTKEVNALINRESGFMIAQSYEALETLLKDLIALHLYKGNLTKYNLPSVLSTCTTLQDFKSGVRRIRSKNNKDLFKLLKKSCPAYSKAQQTNNLGFNLYEWYKVFSHVRHAITHQSAIIRVEQLSKMKPLEIGLLKKFFPGEFTNDDYLIEISIHQARDTLKRIAEFGFLLFKCIAICNNCDWRILKT